MQPDAKIRMDKHSEREGKLERERAREGEEGREGESITYQIPVEKSSQDATSRRPCNGTSLRRDMRGGNNAKTREDAQT